ncbi:MAG: NUDIX domain-containing protein [Clostridiales bacterium]|nr:NUDIX domain-containing protein [Clostridiales bacterium]
MQGYNVIAVYNEISDQWLMCKRKKNPYLGLSNLVGGKIEVGEAGLDAAYRELEEETAITPSDIVLSHLMDFTYYFEDCFVEVYVGKLNKAVTPRGDENDLYWSEPDCDFFDETKYGGEGNIGHIMARILMWRDKVLI